MSRAPLHPDAAPGNAKPFFLSPELLASPGLQEQLGRCNSTQLVGSFGFLEVCRSAAELPDK